MRSSDITTAPTIRKAVGTAVIDWSTLTSEVAKSGVGLVKSTGQALTNTASLVANGTGILSDLLGNTREDMGFEAAVTKDHRQGQTIRRLATDLLADQVQDAELEATSPENYAKFMANIAHFTAIGDAYKASIAL